MHIDGTWINQNGSTVEFESDSAGQMTGYYCTRKSRVASGKRYRISGQLNGDVLAFLVNWRDEQDNLEAITSFSGRIGCDPDGREVIHTLWVLARRWENEERTRSTGMWNAFITNSDVFHRSRH